MLTEFFHFNVFLEHAGASRFAWCSVLVFSDGVLFHPREASLRVAAVLLGASLPGFVDVVAAFLRVVVQRHPVARVLQRIRWRGLPIHDLVLGLQLDVLGRSERANGAHAVALLAGALDGNVGFPEDLLLVERQERFLESLVTAKAGVFVGEEQLDDLIRLLGEQPEVVQAGLGVLLCDGGLVGEGQVGDPVVVQLDAAVEHDESGLFWPAARVEEDEDGCTETNKENGVSELGALTEELGEILPDAHVVLCFQELSQLFTKERVELLY